MEEANIKVQDITRYIDELSVLQEGTEDYRQKCEDIIDTLQLELRYDMVIDQDDRTILQRKGRLESTSKSSHSGVHNRRMTMRAGIEESSRVS